MAYSKEEVDTLNKLQKQIIDEYYLPTITNLQAQLDIALTNEKTIDSRLTSLEKELEEHKKCPRCHHLMSHIKDAVTQTENCTPTQTTAKPNVVDNSSNHTGTVPKLAFIPYPALKLISQAKSIQQIKKEKDSQIRLVQNVQIQQPFIQSTMSDQTQQVGYSEQPVKSSGVISSFDQDPAGSSFQQDLTLGQAENPCHNEQSTQQTPSSQTKQIRIQNPDPLPQMPLVYQPTKPGEPDIITIDSD